MNLVLTGGGDSKYFQKLDQHFLSMLSEKPALLFIPLAGDSDTFGDSLERVTQTFSTIKFENIEMCLNLKDLNWEYIQNFDAIYIDGGNTFKLMSAIRNTHFYELVHRFINHGGIVNGDSAGAIILGSHLQTAHFGEVGDENLSNLVSYQGLNLLGDMAIHCHFEQSEEQEIREFVREYGFPVIAINEKAGITIEEGILKVFGEGNVCLFDPEEDMLLMPGESIEL